MPSQRTTDILTIAKHTAEERNGAARLASFVGTKVHKWRKPGNVAKMGASAGGVFIPIPGLSIATDYVVGKVVEHWRSKSHKKKQRKYAMAAAASPDDPAALAKKMKFDVKDLDVKHLQESIRKVRNQLDMLAKPPAGLSDCGRAFQTAYRYHRAVHRLDRLYVEAEAMVVVGEEILDYCEKIEEGLENGWDKMVKEVDDCLDHEICKAGAGCYNGDNGEQRLRRDAQDIRDKEVALP